MAREHISLPASAAPIKGTASQPEANADRQLGPDLGEALHLGQPEVRESREREGPGAIGEQIAPAPEGQDEEKGVVLGEAALARDFVPFGRDQPDTALDLR